MLPRLDPQHEHWQPAEHLQSDDYAGDHTYRAKAWTAMICGVAGFWVVVGAVLWSAL